MDDNAFYDALNDHDGGEDDLMILKSDYDDMNVHDVPMGNLDLRSDNVYYHDVKNVHDDNEDVQMVLMNDYDVQEDHHINV